MFFPPSVLNNSRNYSDLIGKQGLETFGVSNAKTINKLLEGVSWSPELASSLQIAGRNNPSIQLCLKDFVSLET